MNNSFNQKINLTKNNSKKTIIEVEYCKQVEKHLHKIGVAKPYWLCFKLPKFYDYKNKHYKITNSTTIATDPNTGNLKVYPVWKPTLLGKIVGTILFFGHPLSFLSYDYLIKHFTIFQILGKYWFYLIFTAILSWGFFWNIPSNETIDD